MSHHFFKQSRSTLVTVAKSRKQKHQVLISIMMMFELLWLHNKSGRMYLS